MKKIGGRLTMENPQFGPASSKIDLALRYLLLPFGIKPTGVFPV